MKSLAGSRVLVTGCQGFTGTHIKSQLEAKGCSLFGIVESNPGHQEIVADLGDKAALRKAIAFAKPDFVLHLAAIANVAHADLMQFYKVNVFGTTNLLEALVEEGVTPAKVILASSANIYGNPPVSPVAETTAPAPVNHYAMSKLAMEHMARTWGDRLPIAFSRPFNYTGVGQTEHFLIPKIVGHFKRKEPIIKLGNLDVEREFNDVRMVAAAYVVLLEYAVAGLSYNICSGQGYTMQQVLDLAVQLSGHRLEIQVDPALVRPNELKRLVGDPGLLTALAPNLPRYRLPETMEWMLKA